jgi:poly(beta-D-mannuronate) C5 epimerase
MATRQKGGLRAILIEGGFVDLTTLAQTLPKECFEQTSPGIYIVRLPMLVRHGATLYVGPAVKALRLSQDRASLIANEGNLFILGSQVLGWSEQRQAPTTFRDKHEYRPFIVGWGGSRTYIVDSRVAHLGYASTKAFGLSFSQYSTTTIQRSVWPRPTGWILRSRIEDLWYGFYCWEADDVVLRGNTFRNNIKYGIDPHDRSHRLIIAENDVSGTRQKHGIIISREVDDSWIVHNKSYNNKLSGIVLDRQCSNTVIAHNITYRNGSDGIVISESPGNVLWSNLAIGNQHHGIRLRNSVNVRIQDSSAIANGLAGIYGVSRDLTRTDRDLHEDPYEQALSIVVVGGQLSANGSGPINVDEPSRVELAGIDLRTPQRKLGYRFGGALLPFQLDVLDILLNQNQSTVLEARGMSSRPKG